MPKPSDFRVYSGRQMRRLRTVAFAVAVLLLSGGRASFAQLIGPGRGSAIELEDREFA